MKQKEVIKKLEEIEKLVLALKHWLQNNKIS